MLGSFMRDVTPSRVRPWESNILMMMMVHTDHRTCREWCRPLQQPRRISYCVRSRETGAGRRQFPSTTSRCACCCARPGGLELRRRSKSHCRGGRRGGWREPERGHCCCSAASKRRRRSSAASESRPVGERCPSVDRPIAKQAKSNTPPVAIPAEHIHPEDRFVGRWLHLSVAAAFGHLLAPPANFKVSNKV